MEICDSVVDQQQVETPHPSLPDGSGYGSVRGHPRAAQARPTSRTVWRRVQMDAVAPTASTARAVPGAARRQEKEEKERDNSRSITADARGRTAPQRCTPAIRTSSALTGATYNPAL
jgi:hypothetical protein